MADEIVRIISEFEVRNQQAIDATNEYRAELNKVTSELDSLAEKERLLNNRQKELADQYNKGAISVQQYQKGIAETKKQSEELGTQVVNLSKREAELLKEIKKLTTEQKKLTQENRNQTQSFKQVSDQIKITTVEQKKNTEETKKQQASKFNLGREISALIIRYFSLAAATKAVNDAIAKSQEGLEGLRGAVNTVTNGYSLFTAVIGEMIGSLFGGETPILNQTFAFKDLVAVIKELNAAQEEVRRRRIEAEFFSESALSQIQIIRDELSNINTERQRLRNRAVETNLRKEREDLLAIVALEKARAEGLADINGNIFIGDPILKERIRLNNLEINALTKIFNLEKQDIENKIALAAEEARLENQRGNFLKQREANLKTQQETNKLQQLELKFNDQINNILRLQKDLITEINEELAERIRLSQFTLQIDPGRAAASVGEAGKAITEQNEKLIEAIQKNLQDSLANLDPIFTNFIIDSILAGLDPALSDEIRSRNILKATIQILEDAQTEIRTKTVELSKFLQDQQKLIAGIAPELFDASQKATAESIQITKDQLAELQRLLAQIDADLANAILSSLQGDAQAAERKRDEQLGKLIDGLNSASQIASGLGQIQQENLQRQNNLIDDQIELINNLKDNVLEANSDIIASEERKLSRLVEARRRSTNAIRDLARLEFVASTGAAIAQAAASGPLALPQILAITAAIISGLAQLRQASVTLHTGTEEVTKSGLRYGIKYDKLKPDEVMAKMQVGERVLSKQDNKKIGRMKNWELVRAAQIYSHGFTETAPSSNKWDKANNNLLKDIKEGISSLAFNVSIDKRGFSAGLKNYLQKQEKINSLRR